MNFENPFPNPIFLAVVVFLIWVVLLNKTQKKLPPSPTKLPILGNLHQLIGNLPHVCLEKLSKKHGPLMFLQLGSIPTLVISSSNMAREILKPHDLIFSGRPQLYAAKTLSYNYNNISFAPYGEYWMDVRKIAVSELFSTKRVNSFRTFRSEEVNLVMDSITRCCTTKKHVNISELMISLANNVVCRVAFGMKFDGNGKEILKRAQCLLGELNVADFYPWFGWVVNKFNGVDGRLDRNFRDLDEFYDQVIQQHLDCVIKSEGDDQDFVDVLLQIQKNNSGQTITLNNNQIKGILTVCLI